MSHKQILLASVALLVSPAAYAQNISPAEDGDSVFDNMKREFRGDGIPMGGFIVHAGGQARVGYSDNVFAVSDGPNLDLPVAFRDKVGAFVYETSAGLRVKSNWPTHSLKAYAGVKREAIPDRDSENAVHYEVGGSARLNVGRFVTVEVGGEIAHEAEARTQRFTSLDSQERIELDKTKVYAELGRRAGLIGVSARVERQTVDYEDGVRFDNTVDDQDFRDQKSMGYELRGEYELGPTTDVFVRGRYTETDYDIEPGVGSTDPDRDNDEYKVQAGIETNVTNLIRGEAAVGFATKSYDNPNIDNIDFFAVDVGFDWFVRPTTTVKVDVVRDSRDALVRENANRKRTEAKLHVEQRVGHSVGVGVFGRYGVSDFGGLTADLSREFDRKDKDRAVGVSATYYFRSGVSLSAVYEHASRRSDGLDAGRGFDVNKALATLGFAF